MGKCGGERRRLGEESATGQPIGYNLRMEYSELTASIESGSVETVIVGFTDHYGRLLGKRFDADFFLASVDAGTHACNYLLTADMEMEPIEGFVYTSWDSGYGDFHLVFDMSTLRRAGWTEGVALVLCDLYDGDEPVRVAPRSVLNQQLSQLEAAGYHAAGASELEFFLFRQTYESAAAAGYSDLKASGWYVEDYHLLQGGRVEDYVGAARRALKASEIPVENSKGEAAKGQHELNIGYCGVGAMADRHTIMKHGMKELADQMGVAVSFMAKPDAAQPGNSCHIHLSLWVDGQNAFSANDDVFRWFLGGWIHHTPVLMPFYAPTINSYKRYQPGSWAPTRLAWSNDNRTAGFRIVGEGNSKRIECRIPGGDANPYLAFAASLASGLDGIVNRIEPPDELTGNAYDSDEARHVPTTLRAATAAFAASADARRFFGDDVVDHYAHFFGAECDAYDAAVTDWEKKRYFEQI